MKATVRGSAHDGGTTRAVRAPVSVGVVGLGARGVPLARTLNALPGCELRWIADQTAQALLEVEHELPHVRTGTTLDDLLDDETLDAVGIATPLATRYALARRALEAGKHVLVATPAALASAQADDLVRRAEAEGRQLQMDHEMLFHPALVELNKIIAAGALGELYYLTASRRRLGCLGGDGIIWEAGSEAVAMVLWLVGDEPMEVTAHGGSCAGAGAADVAFCHLRFATGIAGQLVLSAVESQESRRLTVVGSAGMAVFDELDRQRSLTVSERDSSSRAMVSPWLPGADARRMRCESFLSAVRSPAYSHSPIRSGAAVVAVLEALQQSLEHGGRAEPVGVTREPEPVGVAHRPPAGVIQLPLRSA
jgi:predicted dehydrogenase